MQAHNPVYSLDLGTHFPMSSRSIPSGAAELGGPGPPLKTVRPPTLDRGSPSSHKEGHLILSDNSGNIGSLFAKT